jgi:hypothetical protein
MKHRLAEISPYVKSQLCHCERKAARSLIGVATYSHLAEMIHNTGRYAGEHGLARGQMVVLLIKDPILHVAFILGLTVAVYSKRDWTKLGDLPDTSTPLAPHAATFKRRSIL